MKTKNSSVKPKVIAPKPKPKVKNTKAQAKEHRKLTKGAKAGLAAIGVLGVGGISAYALSRAHSNSNQTAQTSNSSSTKESESGDLDFSTSKNNKNKSKSKNQSKLNDLLNSSSGSASTGSSLLNSSSSSKSSSDALSSLIDGSSGGNSSSLKALANAAANSLDFASSLGNSLSSTSNSTPRQVQNSGFANLNSLVNNDGTITPASNNTADSTYPLVRTSNSNYRQPTYGNTPSVAIPAESAVAHVDSNVSSGSNGRTNRGGLANIFKDIVDKIISSHKSNSVTPTPSVDTSVNKNENSETNNKPINNKTGIDIATSTDTVDENGNVIIDNVNKDFPGLSDNSSAKDDSKSNVSSNSEEVTESSNSSKDDKSDSKGLNSNSENSQQNKTNSSSSSKDSEFKSMNDEKNLDKNTEDSKDDQKKISSGESNSIMVAPMSSKSEISTDTRSKITINSQDGKSQNSNSKSKNNKDSQKSTTNKNLKASSTVKDGGQQKFAQDFTFDGKSYNNIGLNSYSGKGKINQTATVTDKNGQKVTMIKKVNVTDSGKSNDKDATTKATNVVKLKDTELQTGQAYVPFTQTTSKNGKNVGTEASKFVVNSKGNHTASWRFGNTKFIQKVNAR